MPTLSITDQLTALEVLNRQGGSPDTRHIIEAMSTVNQILLDAPAKPANERTSNKAVVRTSLPKASSRIYNKGVGKGSSQTKTIVDVVSSIAIYSVVDAKLAEEAPDKQALLSSENVAFIEGMAQDQADDFIYGDHELHPDKMDGFAKRRAKTDGKYCIDMGGTQNGQLTSVYIVKWGDNKAHLIYPKGSNSVGVSREDRGKQDWDDGTNTGHKYPAYVNYYEASYGLTVKDERSLIRLCNIDTKNIDATVIIKEILRAYTRLAPGAGTVCIYANPLVMAEFDIATMEKGNIVLSYADPWGKMIPNIREGRIRQVDAILNTEDKVEEA